MPRYPQCGTLTEPSLNFERFSRVNALRTAEAHKVSKSTPGKISEALEVLGIDQTQCRAARGKALDRVYDQMALSLEEINKLLSEAFE